MANTLFLYIDILGFAELVKKKRRVRELFKIIDAAALHRDSNYQTIVFSDTIISYNKYSKLSNEAQAIELMYLIELTQELFRRLIGTGISFRAVITYGDFIHRKLKNVEAYYGEALIDAYKSEKNLIGTGLFLDKKLRRFNTIFRYKHFSPDYDFIYLTHSCSRLTSWLKRCVDLNSESDFGEFPIQGVLLTDSGDEMQVYPELVHFHEVYCGMNEHPDPGVRAKYLATWNMYCHGYPGLIRSLEAHNFNPNGVAKIDWGKAKEFFKTEYR
jgi:hypothetical protein